MVHDETCLKMLHVQSSLHKLPIFVFLQGLAQIMSSNAGAILMTSFAGVFELSTQKVAENVTAEDDLWCFFDGMKSREKILSDLMGPAFICIFTLIPFIIFQCILCRKLKVGPKTVNFGTAGMGVFLIIIGKIMDTFFKLLRCATIGDEHVHFYFAYEPCYDTPWIVSLVTLSVTVFAFGSVELQVQVVFQSLTAFPSEMIRFLVKMLRFLVKCLAS